MLSGYKTIIIAVLTLAATVLGGPEIVQFLESLGVANAGVVMAQILAVVMLALRVLTTGPIAGRR